MNHIIFSKGHSLLMSGRYNTDFEDFRVKQDGFLLLRWTHAQLLQVDLRLRIMERFDVLENQFMLLLLLLLLPLGLTALHLKIIIKHPTIPNRTTYRMT
jgi:hypothetical protein